MVREARTGVLLMHGVGKVHLRHLSCPFSLREATCPGDRLLLTRGQTEMGDSRGTRLATAAMVSRGRSLDLLSSYEFFPLDIKE